jgi:WD40 repeat protein
MITFRNANASVDVIRYDYLRNIITFQQECLETSVIAMAPNNDYVCVADGRRSSGCILTELSFWDPVPRTNAPIHRKRPRTAISPAFVGTIQSELEDDVGMPTRLESLAWNATGTALVGGSTDGDLFVWDANDRNGDGMMTV